MARITRKGRELAYGLYLRENAGILEQEICSLICRLATTYCRLQETACNRELTRYEARKDELLEKRLTELIESLPVGPEGETWRANLQGDPRGYTVKIVGNGRYNTWGGVEDGYGVEGS